MPIQQTNRQTDRFNIKTSKSQGLSRLAFTLAEVLITLGIIGVVAAMTIPTLINSTNEADIKTGVKAAYSILSQATTMAATENGGTLVGVCSSNFDNVCMKNYMTKYLQTIKDCGGTAGTTDSTNNPTTNGCWKTVTTLTGGSNNDGNNNYAGVVLKNGMLAVFRAHHSDCTVEPSCGWVDIDINGTKPPNTQGKDSFHFNVYQDGSVKPAGTSASSCGTETPATALGITCTYKYLYEN